MRGGREWPRLERRPLQAGRGRNVRGSGSTGGDKENGTFLTFQRPFFRNCLAVYLKEKGKRLQHTLKQKYRCYFFFFYRQVPDPGMHYVAYFGSAISDLPTTRFSTKSLFFFIFFFAFSPPKPFQCLFAIHPQRTHCNLPLLIYMFKSTCSGCILIHLEKTRHLVFSHTTSKKRRDRFFPACTQKIYTSYNLQKEEKEDVI